MTCVMRYARTEMSAPTGNSYGWFQSRDTFSTWRSTSNENTVVGSS